MKRGKRRLIVIAAVLVLTITSAQPVFATGATTRFVDVPSQSWYTAKLIELEAAGDISFRYRNRLAPDKPATTEQFCELLLETMDIWCRPPKRGESWEVPLLEKVMEMSGIQLNPGPITRDLAAEMIAGCLHLSVNRAPSQRGFYAEDVSAAAQAVTEAGIMNGCIVNGEVVFSGRSPLTNAQMIVVGANVKEYITSTEATTDTSDFTCSFYQTIKEGGTYLREDTPFVMRPTTKDEWCRLFDYMAIHELTTITLNYPTACTDAWKTQVQETLTDIASNYFYERPEYFQFCSKIRIRYINTDSGHELKIMLLPRDDSLSVEQEIQMRRAAWSKASAVRDSLYASGQLTVEMSERERAKVLLDWIDQHTVYKDDNTKTGHSAWSVFFRGYGVCDAYSAAYQMLLDIDGIQNWGIKGSAKLDDGSFGPHHWTAMLLDGVFCYSDATWNDSSQGGYFGVTEETLRKTHRWM